MKWRMICIFENTETTRESVFTSSYESVMETDEKERERKTFRTGRREPFYTHPWSSQSSNPQTPSRALWSGNGFDPECSALALWRWQTPLEIVQIGWWRSDSLPSFIPSPLLPPDLPPTDTPLVWYKRKIDRQKILEGWQRPVSFGLVGCSVSMNHR